MIVATTRRCGYLSGEDATKSDRGSALKEEEYNLALIGRAAGAKVHESTQPEKSNPKEWSAMEPR